MKHFTLEYIKECDCKEIQELHDKIKIGDWISFNTRVSICSIEVVTPHNSQFLRENTVWLPSGDQLDGEIVRICNKPEGMYEYLVFYSGGDCNTVAEKMRPLAEGLNFIEFSNLNPLIAKIKLLKELLNAN